MTHVPAPLTIALAIFGLLLVWTAYTPLRAPVPASAPANEFSAARAFDELRLLLGEQSPHPTGSEANDRVRERLMDRLTGIGLVPTTQHTVGCSQKWANCGTVINVFAEIPGEQEAGILMMAHYDSVPAAPGAGDDGAGVAALLEIARVMKGAGVHKNSVMFLFSDAEEPGLLGAEAFFAEHPAATRVKAVINLEGSGSDGPVYLLRIGPNSGALLRAFQHSSASPVAQSFAQEIFKRMPNDTDFSVAMRANVPGIDFSFAGERNHYHTPLDTIEMLDPRTMQHHGDNTLPLLRTLLDADLHATLANPVFATQPGGWWLVWSTGTGLVLAVLGIGLLVFATWRVRASISAGKLLGGAGVALLVLIGSTVLALVAFWIADRVAGTRVNWPAEPWPWLLVIYASPVLFLTLVAPLVRRLGFWAAWLGAWWVWSLLSILCAWATPLAGHLLLPANLIASILALALALRRTHEPAALGPVFVIAAGAFGALGLLGLIHSGPATQGLAFAAVSFVPLALLLSTLTPLLPLSSPDLRLVRYSSAAALVVGLVGTGFVPLYSEHRPQHLSLLHVLDANTGKARYVAWSPNRLPDSLLAVVPFTVGEPADTSVADAYWAPWVDEPLPTAKAPAIPVIPPELVVFEDHDGDAKTRRLLVRSNNDARELSLQIVRSAGLESIEVEGRATAHQFGDSPYIGLRLVNPPPAGYVVELRFATGDPVDAFLIEAVTGLPDFANELSESRGRLAVPVHSGDESMIYRRVVL